MFTRSRRYSWLASLSCLLVPKLGTLADGVEGAPIPMRLEIELAKETYVVHENPSFTVRLVNPNDFPVELRGFEMDSYIEPEVHLLLDSGEELHLRYHPSDSAWTRSPVTIVAGGALEKQRFLWNENLPTVEWPADVGRFELQLRTHLSSARVAGEADRRRIAWERPIVELRVQSAGPSDRMAWAWLEPRFIDYEGSLKNPKPGDEHVALRRLRIYHEFLGRFADSSYAPAIRWETAKLLNEELGNNRIPEEEVADMVDLFEESLNFCLDRGGAYSDDFLKMDRHSSAESAMQFARKHNKLDLLKRIVKAVDQKYPEDEPGILYRRFLVSCETGSLEDARRVVEILDQRFPDSRYTERARRSLQFRKEEGPQQARERP